jgi:hypothetical protein
MNDNFESNTNEQQLEKENQQLRNLLMLINYSVTIVLHQYDENTPIEQYEKSLDKIKNNFIEYEKHINTVRYSLAQELKKREKLENQFQALLEGPLNIQEEIILPEIPEEILKLLEPNQIPQEFQEIDINIFTK